VLCLKNKCLPFSLQQSVSVAAACCLLLFAASASAYDFTVTSLSDAGDYELNGTCGALFLIPGDPPQIEFRCTLRAALEEIQAGGSGVNTITFDPSLSGTITLSSDLPVISRNVTITGPGSDLLTITRQGAGRIFFIQLASPGTVYMSGLRLARASYPTGMGGAVVITSTAFATFEEMVFDANEAEYGGAIYCDGCTLWLRKTRFSGNHALTQMGGAIYAWSNATLDIQDSMFIANTADGGGGAIIALDSAVTLQTSRIEGNSSSHGGGGLMVGLAAGSRFICKDTIISGNSAGVQKGGGILIWGTGASAVLQNVTVSGNTADYEGGGMYIESSLYTVIANSTFSGNRSGRAGGGIRQAGTSEVTLSNVTVANNEAGAQLINFAGGGVYGPVTIENSVISGNVDLSYGAHSPDCCGDITSGGYNIIGDATGCTVTPTAGDNFGDDVTPIDPMIGALKRNGGTTLTHALLSGSPAIDGGNPAGCCWDDNADNGAATPDQLLTEDQRGSPRPWDPLTTGTQICDAGAFEWTNCMNGVQDSNETGIDCGGGCAACSCSAHFAATNGTTYAYVQEAYDATWDGAEIRTREEDTGEALTFDRPAYISLIGGHDCDFFRIKGMTTVASLTVGSGRLTVENVTIGP